MEASILKSTLKSSGAKISRNQKLIIRLASFYGDRSETHVALQEVQWLVLEVISFVCLIFSLDVDAGVGLLSDGVAAEKE